MTIKRMTPGYSPWRWFCFMLFAGMAIPVCAQPQLQLEFSVDPVVFDAFPPAEFQVISLTRRGLVPGDLSDDVTVVLDRVQGDDVFVNFNVPSGWTVFFAGDPAATEQTNAGLVIESQTPGTALLTASAPGYVGDSAWVHVDPQIPLDRDSDGDGIPDWWKMHWFGDLDTVGLGDVDGYTDFDGDGLNDYYEYLARTDPTDPDDDAPWLDADGDGLFNIEEQWYGTHPRRWDTDDDGIDDLTEVFVDITDAVNSLDPLEWRSLNTTGEDGYVYFEDVYATDYYSFTVSAWVKPSDTDGGVLAQKRNQAGYLNFEMGLKSGNRLYLAYQRATGGTIIEMEMPGGGLPVGEWSYVTVIRQDASPQSQSSVRLMVWNGATETWSTHQANAAARPAVGVGTFTLGHDQAAAHSVMHRSMIGELNEVRVWNQARLADGVQNDFKRILWLDEVLAMASLRAYYRFDDGGRKVENFAYPIIHSDHERTRFFEGLKHMGVLTGPVDFVDTTIPVLLEIDTDGDGIPDWWEELYFGSPTGANANADPDGDGISNYWEYRLGSDPHDAYSLWRQAGEIGEMLNDGEWDSDGDGLTNWEEIHLYGTDPTRADTADNGIPDRHELIGDPTGAGNPDPQYITHPLFDMAYYHPAETNQWGQRFTPQRSLDLSVPAAAMGVDWSGIRVPHPERFTINQESAYTWETWIRPLDTNGVIMAYRIGDKNSMELGLSNGYAYFRILNQGGTIFTVGGMAAADNAPLPLGTWTHLTAVWNPDAMTMSLFVNDHEFSKTVMLKPILGEGRMTIAGDGTTNSPLQSGLLNEVRFFGTSRGLQQIRQQRHRLLPPGSALANYRFDDAGLSIRDFNLNTFRVIQYGESAAVAILNPEELDPYRIHAADYNVGITWFPGFSPADNPQSPVGTADWVVTDDAMVFQREMAPHIWHDDFDDLENDNLPDWWQIMYYQNYFPEFNPDFWSQWAWSPVNPSIGLNNLYHFLCRTNPRNEDTDNNGIPDTDEDFDGDGLTNIEEQHHGTDPRRVDTDDDGVSDYEEIRGGYSPLNPMSRPDFRTYSLPFADNPVEGLELPRSDRFNMRRGGWTVEFWYYAESDATGEIFSHDALAGDSLKVGIENGSLYARIEMRTGQIIHVGGVDTVVPFALGEWHHLAVIWDPLDNSFRLRRDGLLLIAQQVLFSPNLLNGIARIGRGMIDGHIDELRVWSSVRRPHEIEYWANRRIPMYTIIDKDIFPDYLYDQHLDGGEYWYSFHTTIYAVGDSLRLYYRFDDAGDRIEDFAHPGRQDYRLEAQRGVPGFAAPVTGEDDETGDRLPQWWVDLHGLSIIPQSDLRFDLKDFEIWRLFQIGNPLDGWDLDSFPQEFSPAFPTNVFLYEADGPAGPHPPTPQPFREFIPFESYPGGMMVRDFIAFGSFGGGYAGADPDGTMRAGLSRVFYDSAQYAALNRHFMIDMRPVRANLELIFDNAVITRLFVNGIEIRNDIQQSVTIDIAEYLHIGRNHVALFLEDTGGLTWSTRKQPPGLYRLTWQEEVQVGEEVMTVWVESDEIYEFDEVGYSWPRSAMKFDASLTVDGRPVIVRGDEYTYDPRAVWYGRAVSHDLAAYPGIIREYADVVGRRWYNPDFGIHNDPDGDQLDNWTEYRVDTNPRDWDSNNNGISDAEEDFSGDGVPNLLSLQLGLDPTSWDTDDDGIPDGQELADGTNPADALSPVVYRGILFDGAGYVEMPVQSRFALASWTIEAWVRPATNAAGGTIIERSLGVLPGSGQRLINYGLGLTPDNRPIVYFSGTQGVTEELQGGEVLVVDGETWTHLAGVFDRELNILTLYVDGRRVGAIIVDRAPVTTGPGTVRTRVGEDFRGTVNEVRFWSRALVRAEIDANIDQVLSGLEDDLNAYYRFDDGGETAQDCLYANNADWIRDWENAAVLHGDAAFVDLGDTPPAIWLTDSNDDNIPDWWYRQYGYDPLGPSVALMDPDGDGINNYWEYRLGSDPHNAYSLDPEGKISDGEWDSDGDGLTNWEEIAIYGTDPTLYDSSDNAMSDSEAVLAGYDPLSSVSPYIQRALETYGYPDAVIRINERSLEPRDRKNFNLRQWTLEAHVEMAELPLANAVLIRRTTMLGLVTFEMGIDTAGRLYAFTESQSGHPTSYRMTAPSTRAMQVGQWYHIAARMADGRMTLFMDGRPIDVQKTGLTPALDITENDVGVLEIAAHYTGKLDELRVWNTGISDAEIYDRHWKTLWDRVDGAASLSVSGNGSMQYASESDVASLDQWTLSSWIRIDPLSPEGIIVAKISGEDSSAANTRYNYSLGINDEGLLVGSHHDYYEYYTLIGTASDYRRNDIMGVTDLRDGEWHHVAFVNDGASRMLYVDGNREAVAGLPAQPGNLISGSWRRFLLSTGNMVFGTGLNALIDETRVHAYPLRGERLNVIKNAAAQLDDFGLISAFTFDFNMGFPRIRDWSRVRDPSEEYGILTGDARLDGENNVPYVPVETLASHAMQLPGYWAFDDAGRFAENFMASYYLRPAMRGSVFAELGGVIATSAPPVQPPAWNAPAAFVDRSEFETDSNNDGIPDWWYVEHGYNPFAGSIAEDDPDNDGIPNLWEYRLGSDPFDMYSLDPAGLVSDADWDSDGDGLTNWEEIFVYGTDPRLPDTDNDGLLDGLEIRKHVDPLDARDPAVSRSLKLDGTAGSYVQMPDQQRFVMTNFTLQAWVNPSSITPNGMIVGRSVAPGLYSYRLGWWTDPLGSKRLAVEFNSASDYGAVRAWTTNELPLNAWSHVAGVFDSVANRLTLYVDGVVAREIETEKIPVRFGAGPTHTRAGQFFDGMLDDVAVYGQALSGEQIELTRLGDVIEPARGGLYDGVVLHYTFDNDRGGRIIDRSGRNLHGMAVDVTHRGDGVYGKAAGFDDAGSYIAVPDNYRLDLGALDDKTFSLWWRSPEGALAGNIPLLSRRTSQRNNRGLLLMAEGTTGYRLELQSGVWIRFNTSIEAGAWNHVILTKQGEQWKVYHNGSELGMATSRNWPPNANVNAHTPLLLGWDQLLHRGMAGAIDEFRIYDRALDADETQALHELRFVSDIPEAPWPVAYYAFDDGTHPDGASGNTNWTWGHVTDFAGPYDQDWRNEWRNAGTLVGNAAMVAAAPPPGIDPPGVLYVTSPDPDGIYYPGDTITIHVVFGAPVARVYSTPKIELDMESTNRFAYYVGPQFPASDTLVFEYVVGWKDWAWDLDYASTEALLPAGGWILDQNMDSFDLTLPTPGEYGSLSWFKNILVDPPDDDPDDMYRLVTRRGISVEWLDRYFEGVTELLDPDRDYDGDGMTLYEAYVSGTDPLDKTSTLRLMPTVALHETGFTVSWPARPDRRYWVEYADCVRGTWITPFDWSNLEYTAPVMSVTDDGSLTGGIPSIRFYRIRVNIDDAK